jgi:hypothetical protein
MPPPSGIAATAMVTPGKYVSVGSSGHASTAAPSTQRPSRASRAPSVDADADANSQEDGGPFTQQSLTTTATPVMPCTPLLQQTASRSPGGDGPRAVQPASRSASSEVALASAVDTPIIDPTFTRCSSGEPQHVPFLSQPPLMPKSTLSPNIAPFYLLSGGRTKRRRWADDDGKESNDDHLTTYLDAVRRPAKPVAVFSPRAQTCSTVVLGHGGVGTG